MIAIPEPFDAKNQYLSLENEYISQESIASSCTFVYSFPFEKNWDLFVLGCSFSYLDLDV